MESKATHRNARLSPRKVRIYRDLLKGLPVQVADSQLQFLPGKGPRIIRAVLRSAVANAQHNLKLTNAGLIVADVVVDGGFTFKRFRPASKGMAHPIIKRTAHVTVIVENREGVAAGPQVVAESAPTRKVKAKEIKPDAAAGKKGPIKRDRHLVEQHQDKTATASQKIKMQQQGGDSKKNYRRKNKQEK